MNFASMKKNPACFVNSFLWLDQLKPGWIALIWEIQLGYPKYWSRTNEIEHQANFIYLFLHQIKGKEAEGLWLWRTKPAYFKLK